MFGGDRGELAILVDIGNSSVTSSLALFLKRDKPIFLSLSKEAFVLDEKTSGEKLFAELSSVLEKVIPGAINIGLKNRNLRGRSKSVSKSLVSFSSPWFLSKSKNVNISEDKPFVITPNFLAAVSNNEEELFKKDLAKNNSTGVSFEIIDKSIIHTKINGYAQDDILGKRTKQLEAYLSMSAIPKNISDKIDEILIKNTSINSDEIFTHTFPLISFSVIRDIFPADSNFMVMDVTGDVTDLTLVSDGILAQTTSFPSGRNFILRQIAKTFDSSLEIAESTLHLYSEDRLDASFDQKMKEIIVNTEKEWAIYLENALTELSSQLLLPSKLYLLADSDVANLYFNFLSMSKTDATAGFRKNLSLVHLNKEALSKNFRDDSPFRLDEFSIILSCFYDKFIKS